MKGQRQTRNIVMLSLTIVHSSNCCSPQTFYIRHLLDRDNQLFQKGVRKIRSIKLPHVLIRGGLPVIVDDSDHVVLIPHFKVVI